MACGERDTRRTPEPPAFPQASIFFWKASTCGQPLTSRLSPARGGHGRSGSRSGSEVMTEETTELFLSVGPYFHYV